MSVWKCGMDHKCGIYCGWWGYTVGKTECDWNRSWNWSIPIWTPGLIISPVSLFYKPLLVSMHTHTALSWINDFLFFWKGEAEWHREPPNAFSEHQGFGGGKKKTTEAALTSVSREVADLSSLEWGNRVGRPISWEVLSDRDKPRLRPPVSRSVQHQASFKPYGGICVRVLDRPKG